MARIQENPIPFFRQGSFPTNFKYLERFVTLRFRSNQEATKMIILFLCRVNFKKALTLTSEPFRGVSPCTVIAVPGSTVFHCIVIIILL